MRQPRARPLLALLAAAALAGARAGGVLPSQPDYLRLADSAAAFPAAFREGPGANELTLSNGLVTRTFTSGGAAGGFATTSLRLESGQTRPKMRCKS